jgi:WD40 repeat protein
VLRLGASRLRHGENVSHLVFSPDGTRVVAYGGNHLSIWDTRTGDVLRQVGLPAGIRAPLVWLAEGRGIALLQRSEGWVWEFTDEKVVPKILPQTGLPVGLMAERRPPDNESDLCYAVSPDGKTLAVGRGGNEDRDRAILVRPLKTGLCVGELPEAKELGRQPGNCKLLLFTPDGKRLVAFKQVKDQKDEELVIVWELATGKETVRFKGPRPTESPAGNDSRPAAVSNTTLAIGLEGGGTSLWDLATGKERKLDTDHVARAPWQDPGTNAAWWYTGTAAVAFAPDGKTLVTAGRDGLVKLWDVASGRPLRTMERHYMWVEALAFSRDGRTLASAGRDGAIRLWDAATGKEVCPQPGHLWCVSAAVLSPDGKTAITAGRDSTLRWWDTATGRELCVVDLPGIGDGLAVSPDGRTVATASKGQLRTWDLATGRETTPANLPDGLRAGVLSFTPDGRRLVTAFGPRVTVLDWPQMKVRRSFDLPRSDKPAREYECQWLAVSPDGRRLVTVAERSGWRQEKGVEPGSDAGGVVDVWDLGTGQRVCRLAEWRDSFRSLTTATFTSDGRVVLAPGTGAVPAQGGRPEQPFQGEAALLDPPTPRWLRSFPGDHQSTGGTVLSPDGRTLYVSFDTYEIVAFEMATGKPRRTLSGHTGFVGALALAPDGRRLLSGSNDASALLWDTTLAGAAKPRKEPLTAGAADGLWAALAGADARAAFAALADLAAAPDRAVALARRELKPVAAPTDAELDRAFADLDGEDFATRQKASRRLAEFGELAVPGVRKRLEKTESVEVRRRALDFLGRVEPPTPSPDRLRQLRAVELLEGIATPAARDMLSELAKGAIEAPLTLDAAAALERLRRR